MAASAFSMDSLSRFVQESAERCLMTGESLASQPADEGTTSAAQSPASSVEEATAPAMEAAWQRASLAFSQGQVLSAEVNGWNRGGLLVRWGELQGFVPASQLKQVPIMDDPDERQQMLAGCVGKKLELRIIELDRQRSRLVFSERATLWGADDGIRVLEEIRPGDVRRGKISNICDFGAFVDLGGIDGLIHLSELSWGRIYRANDVVNMGDTVDVYVLNVDRSQRRIALSLKRLKPDPWSIVEKRYQVGQVVPATITNVVDFGAFAQIEEGLEGLIHISEFPDSSQSHPSEVVAPGDRVTVCIMRIDSSRRRMGLSLRLAQEAARQSLLDRASIEADHEAGASPTP